MKKNQFLYILCEENNHLVIDYYIRIVAKAFEHSGFNVYPISRNKLSTIDKKSLIFVVTSLEFVRCYFKGFRNIVFWSQGVFPEESALLHNNSLIRYIFAGLIEKFALKKAKMILLVSNTMKDYYEKKYDISFHNNYYIMPCYNCTIEKTSFDFENKYINNKFCYVGSLAEWQCFKETAELYKKIEPLIPNAEFLVCTKDTQAAAEIINKIGIKKYTVQFVEQALLPSVLASCKYGFVIRKESPINQVATPTKISTYLSNGLIPIVSSNISEFVQLFNGYNYMILLENDEIDNIIKFTQMQILSENVYHEFSLFFDTYYNTGKHIVNLSNMINKLFVFNN